MRKIRKEEYVKPLLIIKFFLLVTAGLLIGILFAMLNGCSSKKDDGIDRYDTIEYFDEVYHPYIKRMK